MRSLQISGACSAGQFNDVLNSENIRTSSLLIITFPEILSFSGEEFISSL
jgi:hypothetical protein